MVLDLIGIISALIIGISLGFVLQRGRGCTNTAFRNLFLVGNSELSLMLVIAVCIEIVGFYLLSFNFLGIEYNPNPIPFSYLFIPLGGFIFGIGTVFAGGCAGGVCYRIGEGSGSSLLAFLGFGSGIGLFTIPQLNGAFNTGRTKTLVLNNGSTPSLTNYFPHWVWVVLALVIFVFTVNKYKLREKNKLLKLTHLLPGWSPIKTGLLIGFLGILARYFSTLSGREFGLSTTDGIAEIFQTVILFQQIGWAGLLIIGLILGSLLSSIIIGEFKTRIPPLEISSLRPFFGGILLGIGAYVGSGCNFGHIFGGIPELGLSSFVAVIFMILGNGITSRFYYNKLGNELPSSTPTI